VVDLAYGAKCCVTADYSGGTAAELHGFPQFPSLQIEIRVYVGVEKESTWGGAKKECGLCEVDWKK